MENKLFIDGIIEKSKIMAKEYESIIEESSGYEHERILKKFKNKFNLHQKVFVYLDNIKKIFKYKVICINQFENINNCNYLLAPIGNDLGDWRFSCETPKNNLIFATEKECEEYHNNKEVTK